MGRVIFTLSPGSTSTKFAVFNGEKLLFKVNLHHDPNVLKQYTVAKDQFEFRKNEILKELNDRDFNISAVDAFAAYSGGLVPCEGGIYPVNEKIIEDSLSGRVNHPAVLGASLIKDFATLNDKPCFLVNPPDSDEFQDLARVTGLKGIYRKCSVHVLNQKEVGIRYANFIGKKYEDCNFIIAHIGGGLSVTAQKRGKIIDSNDVLDGSGPMAPNRSGTLPAMVVVKMCFSGKYSEKDMKSLIGRTGGLMNHLGTDNTMEIEDRIKSGNHYAKLIYDAMAYQTAKEIGGYASVLEGKVDGIGLTGGVANDEYFIDQIAKYVSWIAPVKAFPGDFEMEALAAGANRALDGIEKTKVYTGIPVFSGFNETK